MIITKENFIDICNRIITIDEMENKLHEIGIDMIDSPLYDSYFWFVDSLMDKIILPEYRDTFDAYMYPEDNFNLHASDRPNNPLLLYDDDDNIVNSIATLEDLYNYIKGNDGFDSNYRTK